MGSAAAVFPTPSTQRRIPIDFGSYKWLNARFHELLARWICSQKGKEKRGWTEWSPYKSLLLKHWGLSSYTIQSFLLSPKVVTKYVMVLGFPKNQHASTTMVLLLCPARLQNPKSIQSMAPAVLRKSPLESP
jgi:hypothetical protein